MSEPIPGFQPSVPEREVRFLDSVSIDGAPVAYVVVLAAVVTTLSFVPFSVTLSSGGSFPLSQGVFALVGFLLGPWAGAAASGIGAGVGVLVAPHTAGLWPVSISTAMAASFAAGCFGTPSRRHWWLAIAALWAVGLSTYLGRAFYVNHIEIRTLVLGSLVDWGAFLLFVSPARRWSLTLLGSDELRRVALGLALGTFMGFGFAHTYGCAVTYPLFNWPREIWVMLIPIIPFEFAIRSAVGAVIGAGVISGLRAIGLVRPTHAAY